MSTMRPEVSAGPSERNSRPAKVEALSPPFSSSFLSFSAAVWRAAAAGRGRARASRTARSEVRFTSLSSVGEPSSYLAHQRQEIGLRVAEEGQPQVVVRELGDEMRVALEGDAAAGEGGVGGLDVGHLEVEDRGQMVVLGALGLAKVEAHSAAVEEGHGGTGLEQEAQAEDVAVEGDGALEVVDVDRDLADRGRGEVGSAGAGHGRSSLQ